MGGKQDKAEGWLETETRCGLGAGERWGGAKANVLADTGIPIQLRAMSHRFLSARDLTPQRPRSAPQPSKPARCQAGLRHLDALPMPSLLSRPATL